jgi:hypothetical protein
VVEQKCGDFSISTPGVVVVASSEVTTYLIEAYVAGGDVADLQDRARATAEAMRNDGYAIRYLRSVLVRADETCFHLFDAVSEDIVAELARRAELPYSRIVEAEEKAERMSARKE